MSRKKEEKALLKKTKVLFYNIGNCAWNVRNFACSNKIFLMQKRPPKKGVFS